MNIVSSRDTGNKFMFGNFMMGSKFAVPPTKRDPDITKPWAFLTKNDKANDYDLGGEVFSYPGMGNVEDRTWRVMDGNDSSAKISESGIKMWVAKEMMKGANGIAVWLKNWTYKRSFLEKLSSVCKLFKVKIIGFTPPYPKADGYSSSPDCDKGFSEIFDYMISYKFRDNWISVADDIKTMKNEGYTNIMGGMQDTFSKGSSVPYSATEGDIGYGAFVEKHNDYAVWKNLAAWCVCHDKPFCLYNVKKTYSESPKKLNTLKKIFNGTIDLSGSNFNWHPAEGDIVGPGEGEEGDTQHDAQQDT